MSNKSFYKNSLMLIASNLTTGILGFTFSIILSRSLGAEGMGLYGLVMPIYNLFICLICGGVITAISKLSAIYFDEKSYFNLKSTIRTTLFFNLIWGVLIAILVFFLAPFISSFIIKDSRTVNAIRITCPAMVFIACSNILKGYFYGTSEILVPAIIDIFEKAVRISVIISISMIFKLSSVTTLVTVSYLALCIGEFISLTFLYIYYKKSIYKLKDIRHTNRDGRGQLLFNVLIISLPLCLNGFLTTALDALCTLLLPRRLLKAGIEYSMALGLIGKFTGMTMNIVFFPMIVVGSISTLLIPDLSQTINKKDYDSAALRIKEVLKIALLLGLSTLAICNAIPKELGFMFFKRQDLGPFIAFASLCAPFSYCSFTTYSILNGISKQNIILRNSIIGALIEISSLFILASIPSINIFGYGISLMITAIVVLILNLYEINKHIKINFSLFQIVLPILIGVLCFFSLKIVSALTLPITETFKNIFIIALGFSFFLIGIFIKDNTKNPYYYR